MIIYKYLDEIGAIEAIKNNSVLLNAPTKFNDPFDSLYYVDDEELNQAFELFMNYELFKKMYNELVVQNTEPNIRGVLLKECLKEDVIQIKKKHIYKSKPYLSKGYEDGLKLLNTSDKEIKNRFKAMVETVFVAFRSSTLVSCFGSSNDSLLMWSHYANKHRGACIKFLVEDNDFKQVLYSKDFPKFELVKALEIIFGHALSGKSIDTENPNHLFMLKPIFVKSNVWEYEGEIRCIYSKNQLNSRIYKSRIEKEEKYFLKMPRIKAVYFGCCASKEFIDEIISIAKNIPVFKMEMSEGEYTLTPREIR